MDGPAGPAQQPHHLPFQFSPILIGLLGIIAGAIMVATYQCIAISCHNNRRGPGPVLNPAAFRREQEARRRARPSRPGIARALHLLPVFVFGKGCEEGTCAVCLGEFGEGEELRRLPRCDHVFHVECVDMWLFSHASCPLCRAEVAAPPVEVVVAPAEELPV